MRRLAFVGGLVLALSLIGPASAAPDTAWKATLAHGGVSGTVTVSITSSTSSTLVENVGGLTPRTQSVLWLRSGSCSATGFGVVRVRAFVPASGHLVLTVHLTPAMVGYFTFDMKHRGGVHATMTSGSKQACGAMVASH